MEQYNLDDLKRLTIKKDSEEREKIKALILRKYDGFWQYLKYENPKMFNESRKDLKLMAYAIYLLIFGYAKNLALSAQRRSGKSHIVNSAVRYMIGINPKLSHCRSTYAEDLALKHSRFIRDGIQNSKAFNNLFPNIKLKSDEKATNSWKVVQAEGEPTFRAVGIFGGSTGFGVSGLNIADDLINSMQQAYSSKYLDTLSEFKVANFLSSEEKSESVYTYRHLEVSTRWTDNDSIGMELESAKRVNAIILEFNAYEKELNDENINEFTDLIVNSKLIDKDWVYVRIPALNKYNKSTCEATASTERLLDIREKLIAKDKRYIWDCLFQQDPSHRKSALFSSFGNWYYNKDLKEIIDKKKYDGKIIVIDPAGKGKNKTSSSLAYIVGNDIYVSDLVYDAGHPKTTKPRIVRQILKYKPDNIAGEGNGGGQEYLENLELMYINNYNVPIDIEHTSENKELKIFLASDWILNHVWLPAKYDEDGKEQYQAGSDMSEAINALQKYVGKTEGGFVKNQEDDFLDNLCKFKKILDDYGVSDIETSEINLEDYYE